MAIGSGASRMEGLKTDSATEKYLQMLKDHRVRGYLFEQQNYLDGKK
jgi:hypothetical protein